jgi:iron(III) transport system substrate-binding protein
MNALSIKFSALIIWTVASTVLMCAAGSSQAQSVSDVALYQGADRHERLVEAAKKEGQVSIYHTWANRDMQPVFNAFTQKYGIAVKPWRSGSEAVLQRIITEARGGRFDVDIVQENSPETEALYREKLLQEVRSPYLKNLVPQAIPAHKEWAGVGIDVFVPAYNTSKVKKEELPKTYQDLLDPKWKGRIGVESDDDAWFGTLVEAMGEKQALKLFTDIFSRNGSSPNKGHSAFTGLIAAGQVPIGLTNFHYMPEELKQKGAPIESFVLEPVVAQVQSVAMLKQAPHPNAAVLFYDFMLNEGQALLASRGFVATSKNIKSTFDKAPLTFINPGRALDMSDKWRKTWEEIVLKNAKQAP